MVNAISPFPVTMASLNINNLHSNSTNTSIRNQRKFNLFINEFIQIPIPHFCRQARHALLVHYQNEQQNSKRFEDSYKTVMCENWLERAHCDFGKNCRFAHGFEEIRPSRYSTHFLSIPNYYFIIGIRHQSIQNTRLVPAKNTSNVAFAHTVNVACSSIRKETPIHHWLHLHLPLNGRWFHLSFLGLHHPICQIFLWHRHRRPLHFMIRPFLHLRSKHLPSIRRRRPIQIHHLHFHFQWFNHRGLCSAAFKINEWWPQICRTKVEIYSHR